MHVMSLLIGLRWPASLPTLLIGSYRHAYVIGSSIFKCVDLYLLPRDRFPHYSTIKLARDETELRRCAIQR